MTVVSSDIKKAAQLLTIEELVAIPTETVYGLAANIFSEKAVKKIFEVKQRPLFNPLIVHLSSIKQVREVVRDLPPKAEILARHFWPGPLTLILEKSDIVPDLVTAGKKTVAVRIPNHPLTRDLLNHLSFPIAAPSANPFNRISPTSADHVYEYFKDVIPMILDGGECERGIESTIIGFEGGDVVVYRLGSLSLDHIESIIGSVSIRNKENSTPDAPGMLLKHYSPKTRTLLVEDVKSFISENPEKSIGVLSFYVLDKSENVKHLEVLSLSEDLEEAASNLYSALHRLDKANVDLIVAERLPDEGLGKSINDRLERASG